MISSIMTDTVDVYRDGTGVSDGLGGFKYPRTKISTVACRIMARSQEETLGNAELHAEATNIIYSVEELKTGDTIQLAGPEEFVVLTSQKFKDALGLGGDHYKSYLKRVKK